MKRLLFILLFYAIGQLFYSPIQAGQYVITKLPDTLTAAKHSGDTWDTVTIAGTKLTSTTNGILLRSNFWYINLGSDTIVFGTDSTYRVLYYEGAMGIDVGYGYHDITIHGGYILHDPDNIEADDSIYVAGDTLNYYGICIITRGTNYNILIDSIIEARVRGAYYASTITAIGRNIRIRKSRLFNDVYAYPTRTMFQAAVLNIPCDSAMLIGPGDYHVKVDSCYLEDNAHAAVYMRWAATNTNDRCNVQFYGDTFVVDARNRRYVGFNGDLGHSTTQTYGIVAIQAGRGTVVNHCTFLSGTKYGGGRGINLIGGDAVADEPIKICSSYFNNHEGYNQEYGPGSGYGCSALKMRQSNRWVNVFDNVLIVTVDTTTAICGQYNPNGEPIAYQVWENTQPPFHVNIQNNICSLKTITNANGYWWDCVAFKFDYVKYEDTSSHFTGNHFYSQGTSVIDYGQFDGGADFVTTQNNTLELDTTGKVYDQSTFNLGIWGGNAGVDSNVMSLDDKFAGGASPNSVTHKYHGGDVETGYQEIHIARTLNLHVKGSNGIGVSQAACSVWSQYGLVGTGLTDGTGNISIVCPYAYYSRTAPDSVGYNDYIIRAQKDTAQAYDSSLTINQVATIVADTLTLTLGSNPPEGFDPAMRRIQRRWMFKL
jgi:hypothetical protein